MDDELLDAWAVDMFMGGENNGNGDSKDSDDDNATA